MHNGAPMTSTVPTCGRCEQPFATADTCTPDPAAVPYGDEREGWAEVGVEPPARCHDCNVPLGGLHHGFCDVEVCAGCGAQALGHTCP
jgi:hypothetical protein